MAAQSVIWPRASTGSRVPSPAGSMMRTREASTRATGSAADAIGGLTRVQRRRCASASAATVAGARATAAGATVDRGLAADRAAHERRSARRKQDPGALGLRAVVAVGGAFQAGERPTVTARRLQRGVGADDRERERDLGVDEADQAAGEAAEAALAGEAPRRLRRGACSNRRRRGGGRCGHGGTPFSPTPTRERGDVVTRPRAGTRSVDAGEWSGAERQLPVRVVVTLRRRLERPGETAIERRVAPTGEARSVEGVASDAGDVAVAVSGVHATPVHVLAVAEREPHAPYGIGAEFPLRRAADEHRVEAMPDAAEPGHRRRLLEPVLKHERNRKAAAIKPRRPGGEAVGREHGVAEHVAGLVRATSDAAAGVAVGVPVDDAAAAQAADDVGHADEQAAGQTCETVEHREVALGVEALEAVVVGRPGDAGGRGAFDARVVARLHEPPEVRMQRAGAWVAVLEQRRVRGG